MVRLRYFKTGLSFASIAPLRSPQNKNGHEHPVDRNKKEKINTPQIPGTERELNLMRPGLDPHAFKCQIRPDELGPVAVDQNPPLAVITVVIDNEFSG